MTTKYYQLNDVILSGCTYIPATRKMTAVIFDEQHNLIITHYNDPRKFLAATLVYNQEVKENKIEFVHTYDSNDYNGNYQRYYTDVMKDIFKFTLAPNVAPN